jgi:hypothetical protein
MRKKANLMVRVKWDKPREHGAFKVRRLVFKFVKSRGATPKS